MHHARFHEHHGRNIKISIDGLTASRVCSFSHGVCFGSRPLRPGELFLVEVTSQDSGWNGHLRIGLTEQDPEERFHLPQYALPDLLATMGGCWLWAMSNRNYTQSHNYIVNYPHNDYNVHKDEIGDISQPSQPSHDSALSGNREFLRTGHTVYSRSLLLPDKSMAAEQPADQEREEIDEHEEVEHEEAGVFDLRGLTDILPTDIGAKIGILYTRSDGKFDIYLVVNGCEVGPLVKDIPMRTGNLWPILDIYGTTNQVKIVQMPINDSLLSLCREVIVQCLMRLEDIDKLYIPDRLKNYLQFKEN